MHKPAIIIHGGAGSIKPEIWREFCEGSHAAALVGQGVLDEGGAALDAAIAATLYLENHPAFNAGRGSALNLDGEVENDALVMTDDRNCGAVAGVTGVKNPVLLARVVLEKTPHLLIVGEGTRRLAIEHGLELCDPADMVVERRLETYRAAIQHRLAYGDNPEVILDRTGKDVPADTSPADTVGACAIDAAGRLAVASSTGGIMLKLPGRAGDTPVIGGGTYCGPAGAVTCTGHGESAMRVCLAKYAYDLLERGADAGSAAQQAVDHLVATIQGRAGLVIVDRAGNRSWATSTERIAVGLAESMPEESYGYLPAAE